MAELTRRRDRLPAPELFLPFLPSWVVRVEAGPAREQEAVGVLLLLRPDFAEAHCGGFVGIIRFEQRRPQVEQVQTIRLAGMQDQLGGDVEECQRVDQLVAGDEDAFAHQERQKEIRVGMQLRAVDLRKGKIPEADGIQAVQVFIRRQRLDLLVDVEGRERHDLLLRVTLLDKYKHKSQ
jgi:hypothetical protein